MRITERPVHISGWISVGGDHRRGQFALGMGGAIVLAVVVVQHFQGIGSITQVSTGTASPGLLGALALTAEKTGQQLSDILDFVPRANHPTTPLALFVTLLFAGWWRLAEGFGYIVQRLAACKNEAHAQAASLWFAVAHNAIRPWPWLIVGLAALVIYPQTGSGPEQLTSQDQRIVVRPGGLDLVNGGTLEISGAPIGAVVQIADQRRSIRLEKDRPVVHFDSFKESGWVPITISTPQTHWRIEGLSISLGDREMAYPLLMGRFLPPGLLGLVIASLLAAFMSTIDTHTNWGASYLVRDVYQRFLRPNASDRHYVMLSRLCIAFMAILGGGAAFFVTSIADVWRFLVTLGAGLGSVTAARWYWSRVTPHAEFAALGVTTLLTVALQIFCTNTLLGDTNALMIYEIPGWLQIIIIASASLCAWIPMCLWGPQNDEHTLRRFAYQVRPVGPGWRGYQSPDHDSLRGAFLRFILGAVVVFGSLFGIGYLILGATQKGLILSLLAVGSLMWIVYGPTKNVSPQPEAQPNISS
ncbi:MAG: hypothetical protein R3C68_12445 [Myxococcota bacterium]